ncbi:MAG: glycosyltransferase family 9 protein [Elusimicrobiota bacterium]
MKKSKILVIVFKGIGDVILTTPLVRALKEINSENEVYFLTRKFAAPVLEKNPNLSGIFIREEKPLLKILSLKPDISIDFMLSSSSGGYCIFSGASKRLAFHRPWNGFFYNLRLKTDFEGYTVFKRLEILKLLGINPEPFHSIKPEIFLSPEEKNSMRELLKEKGLSQSDKIATFDITSPRTYRQLSGDKFASLADHASSLGYRVIFHPGPGEESYVNQVSSLCRRKHLIMQRLTLRQLAALISFSSLHVGTSSAPMHMAVSFNVPTFTVYSQFTSPKAWSPPSPMHGFIQGELEKLKKADIESGLGSFLRGLEKK